MDILAGYARDAEQLIPRFEALDSAEVLAPILDLLPPPPALILEVGAGTGRDSAWLAAQGHELTAVEPVHELRSAGMELHADAGITWLDDRLPHLGEIAANGAQFDLILAVAVWQHLQPEEQQAALATLARLAAPQGRIIISVRHGPGSPERPCFPADVDRMIEWAADQGLAPIRRVTAPSVQQNNRDAGVTWTWLAFEGAARSSQPDLAPATAFPHMRRGSRADGVVANPVRSGRKQP